MKPIFEAYREFIPDYEDFLESLNRSIATHLRINTLKIEPSLLVQALTEQGVLLKKTLPQDETLFWAPDLAQPGHLIEYQLGYIHSQSLTSCLAALALAVQPGCFVLDLCAAPGGKTAQLAQMMQNSGLIVANELFRDRQRLLQNNLARLGVLNAVLTAYPGQEFPKQHSFHHVLADVPCSGEGRFRIHSEKERRFHRPPSTKLIELQKRMILRGFDLLKARGTMIYATCTYDPRENEAVVEYLLKNREAELLPIQTGPAAEPGLTEWQKEHYDRTLQKAVRFYPHRLDAVGFFMARIGKPE
jgi:NOL1/NOP2/sun family putative RNA methylase